MKESMLLVNTTKSRKTRKIQYKTFVRSNPEGCDIIDDNRLFSGSLCNWNDMTSVGTTDDSFVFNTTRRVHLRQHSDEFHDNFIKTIARSRNII